MAKKDYIKTAAWQPKIFKRYIRTFDSSSRVALIETDEGQAYLKAIKNPDDIPKIIVLDTWLRNCDRYAPRYGKDGQCRINMDNLFLSERGANPGNFVLKAIDHGHIFTCGHSLSRKLLHIENVKDDRLYGAFPFFREYIDVNSIDNFAEALFRNINAQLWQDLFDAIPDAWEIDKAICNVIDLFLLRRAEFLIDNIHDMAHEELNPGTFDFDQKKERRNE